MSHQFASIGHMPTLGQEKSIEEISKDITQEEIREVALHDSKYGTGMYSQQELVEAFRNYKETGETNSSLVSGENIRKAVQRAGLDGEGELERFLYSTAEGLGEVIFVAEGQHKRLYRDKENETAFIEAREQMYDEYAQRELLETVARNHQVLEEADSVKPPSETNPELIYYNGEPLLKYGFNDSMIPSSNLTAEEYSAVEGALEEAEEEMKQMIEEDIFRTTQNQDFHFTTGGPRAKKHALVDKINIQDLENLDEIIVGDLGETQRTFGNSEETQFAI